MKNPAVYMISVMIGVILVTSMPAGAFDAGNFDVTKGEYRRRDEDRTYIVGRVVGIGDTLQHRPGGADAQDALFSKGRQGLLTSGGVLWTFVDNIKGQELQWNKEYLGTYVTIHGWAFHDAHYIEVDSFTIDNKAYQWNDKSNTFEPAAAPVEQQS